MNIKEIVYGRVKSCNFNNEKVEIVVEVKEDENVEKLIRDAKNFVAKQLGDEVIGTYSVSAFCDNCKKRWEYGDNIEIPRGKQINEVNCPYCGSYGTLRNI